MVYIKNKWIVSVGLTVISVTALILGQPVIATGAMGFLGGWLAAEKNSEGD